MPDESCRNCGGNLSENTKCSQCFKPTSMICNHCEKCTQVQFHSFCMSYQTNQTNAVPTIESGNYSMVVAMA
ncbi:hypothetical protein C5F47_05925 [Nitrosopumilus cobalaminigenes]|uniref:Uncharacterized protein n=1 Tax=Nitrosopumilus cobalaminigenes TaxID=1470066 RepID=A0A7D5R2Q8_9ARCH|nr:hypothetical protein C5F47_05925 [Nitrosopumilus cobalaminigenes]